MSERTIFSPLEAGLIDEGMFLVNLNKALKNLQSQLIAHARQHGHKATKSKATLKAEITLVVLDAEHDTYGCISQIKTSLPAAPAAATMLMANQSQTGENVLMCRRSGSAADHPKQRVFATQDGRRVDPETGAILEEAVAEAIECTDDESNE